MCALNKVRANAENLASKTELNCTPKTLSPAITDKHYLKDFKHPKSTSAAQVISSETTFAQIDKKRDDDDDDDEDDDGLEAATKFSKKLGKALG
jgi:hypothetical protein